MNKINVVILLVIFIVFGLGVFFVNSLYLNDGSDGGNISSYNNHSLNDDNILDNDISTNTNGIKQNNQKIKSINSKQDVKKNNRDKPNKTDSERVKSKISKEKAIEIAKIYLNSYGFTNLKFKRVFYDLDSWDVEFYDLDNKRIMSVGIDGITGEIIQPQ